MEKAVLEQLSSPSLVMQRDFIARHAACLEGVGAADALHHTTDTTSHVKYAYLCQLIIGRYVRANVGGTSKLLRVVACLQTSAPYTMDYVVPTRDHTATSASGHSVPKMVNTMKKLTTRLLLLCWDAFTLKLEELPLAVVSSRPPSSEEKSSLVSVAVSLGARNETADLSLPLLSERLRREGDGVLDAHVKDAHWRFLVAPPSKEHFDALLAHTNSIITEQRVGDVWACLPASSAGGEPALWGTQAGHTVTLVLRSWFAQDMVDGEPGPVAVAGQKRKRTGEPVGDTTHAASSAEFVVPPLPDSLKEATSSTVLPCLEADGRGIDDFGYGHGGARKRVRVIGQHRFAVLQTEAGLDFPHCSAHVASSLFGSAYQPDVTAWHMLRKVGNPACEAVTLDRFREAILWQAEAGSVSPSGGVTEFLRREGGEAPARYVVKGNPITDHPIVIQTAADYPTQPRFAAQPGSDAIVPTVAISRGGEPKQITFSVENKCFPRAAAEMIGVRRLTSNHQLFVVDFDKLVFGDDVEPPSLEHVISRCHGLQYADGTLLWSCEDEVYTATLLVEGASASTSPGIAPIYAPRFAIPREKVRPWADRVAGFMRQLMGLVDADELPPPPSLDLDMPAPAAALSSLLHAAQGATQDRRMAPTSISIGHLACRDGMNTELLTTFSWAWQVAAMRASAYLVHACGHDTLAWPVQGPLHSPLHTFIPIRPNFMSKTYARLGLTAAHDIKPRVVSPAWCPFLFPHRYNAFDTVLYHGTHLELAHLIKRDSFKRPGCRMNPLCVESDGKRCECQMEAFGVYVAELEKASGFATKKGIFVPSKNALVGAVVGVRVDLGFVKIAMDTACKCGCSKHYVDHPGYWYSNQGYDTLYVRENSKPASNYREWAIADPLRCIVTDVTEICNSFEVAT